MREAAEKSRFAKKVMAMLEAGVSFNAIQCACDQGDFTESQKDLYRLWVQATFQDYQVQVSGRSLASQPGTTVADKAQTTPVLLDIVGRFWFPTVFE